jgi:hypothetical protein
LALTLPTSSGLSVGIIRLRTKTMEFWFHKITFVCFNVFLSVVFSWSLFSLTRITFRSVPPSYYIWLRHLELSQRRDVSSCSLVELHWYFEGTYCLHLQNKRKEDSLTLISIQVPPKRPVLIYQTARHHISEYDGRLMSLCHISLYWKQFFRSGL